MRATGYVGVKGALQAGEAAGCYYLIAGYFERYSAGSAGIHSRYFTRSRQRTIHIIVGFSQ